MTDMSYQTPPMASASPATIPPEAVVEEPTPQVSCACGEVMDKSNDGKELVLYTDDDGVGDVIKTDSSEEHFPDENEVPLPVCAPPPGYTPVCGQRTIRTLLNHLWRPYHFPYAEHVDCQGHSHPRLPMPDPSLCL